MGENCFYEYKTPNRQLQVILKMRKMILEVALKLNIRLHKKNQQNNEANERKTAIKNLK